VVMSLRKSSLQDTPFYQFEITSDPDEALLETKRSMLSLSASEPFLFRTGLIQNIHGFSTSNFPFVISPRGFGSDKPKEQIYSNSSFHLHLNHGSFASQHSMALFLRVCLPNDCIVQNYTTISRELSWIFPLAELCTVETTDEVPNCVDCARSWQLKSWIELKSTITTAIENALNVQVKQHILNRLRLQLVSSDGTPLAGSQMIIRAKLGHRYCSDTDQTTNSDCENAIDFSSAVSSADSLESSKRNHLLKRQTEKVSRKRSGDEFPLDEAKDSIVDYSSDVEQPPTKRVKPTKSQTLDAISNFLFPYEHTY